ncbi:MAG: FAD-dependent oxidoreductase [Bdellovibrionales bacterium]|jgi:L-aspartate oxidase|nr:FAD-dependent oxidoreductase [Bdellovibrionales bacterium]
MKVYQYDVMIIGTGIAGLSCAIKLSEKGLKVGLITREEDPLMSNTYYAQGGIVYLKKGDETFENDVMAASSNTSYLEAIHQLTLKSGQALEEILLEKAKVAFATKENGDLCYTREAAHSESRILFKGDFTGKSIQTSLLNYIKDKTIHPNIQILQAHTAIDLITPMHHGHSLNQRYGTHQVVGAYLFDQKNNQVVKAMSKMTVLATGGVGALYLHHSNSEGARGDGHAMAKRVGANLINMEFIQFHPTTFFDQSGHRRFLISEALRGEGGVLINSSGTRFMEKYHKDLELAPRDVVARAIVDETIETRHDCVYLDISHKNSDWLKERFPTIYKYGIDKGADITKHPIPVVPAAHYTCGGVATDIKGKTNVKNLYAIGEVACTGLHGANRLASTSLLEGLCWGQISAEDIIEKISNQDLYPDDLIRDWELGSVRPDTALINQDMLTLKQTMWNYVGLKRTVMRLERGEAIIKDLFYETNRFYRNAFLTDKLIGLRNAVEVSAHLIKASQRNKTSIGCFYRED